MSSDTFSTAISVLRTHTQAPLPQLYTHLCSLLTHYTSGLSLPITLDTLPSNLTKPSFHEFTLVKTHPKPLLHLLKPLKSAKHTPFHAFFPPSTFPVLPPGTILRLPLTPVSSDALTLAKSIFPDTEIIQAHLPTLSVLIRLPFPKPLPLPHPHDTYTLENIWNLRDLTPPAVFATLHSISSDASSLTLIDAPSTPPVTLTLLPARKRMLHFLTQPCKLLVTAPVVTPTEQGFMLHDAPSSTFFIHLTARKKRQREEVPRLHSPQSLRERDTSEIEHPLTVHARVQGVRNSDVDEHLLVNLGDVEIVIPNGAFEVGDELVLTGVQFRNTWFAQRVHNISTMLGLLYCPFVTRFITIQQATALCNNGKFLTAFVRVRVRAINSGELVKLHVEDCSEEAEHGGSGDAAGEGANGVILLKDRGFHQLFASTKDAFLRLQSAELRKTVQDICDDVWRIIVCCGVAKNPVLTACLHTS